MRNGLLLRGDLHTLFDRGLLARRLGARDGDLASCSPGEAMIQIGADAKAQLLAFARSWCALAARGEWDAALAMIDEPNCCAIVWTRESILALVNDTFSEGTIFAAEFGRPEFSMPDAAAGRERHSFGRRNDGGYWLDYAVPLNGHFSDLTAQFEFHPRGRGFAAVLHDLHVM